jgi:sulfur carrier protein ThiS
MTATGLAFGGDTSTAEHLFRQGLESMKRNQFKEACDAFAGSNEADPSPGTEINLALCNEKQGKLASAWGWYRTAAGLAEQRGQKERAELARAEAVKLEPKLHKLVVSVKFPVDGLVVTRNGQPVPSATFGTDVPVDPGDHTIEVNAKGKKPWKQTVHIAPAAGVDRVDVPQLEDAPAESKPAVVLGPAGPAGADYVPPVATRDGTTQRNIGFIVGGAGIVSGIVAIALEFLALREKDKSDEFESQANAINVVIPPGGPVTADQKKKQELFDVAKSRHDAAKSNELIAIVTGVGGVVLIGVGVTLLLTAPSSKSSGAITRPLVVPILGRDNAGLGLVGTF